jgi:hypothetical protein
MTEPPPPAVTEDAGAYTHDGFFLRLGLGIGYGIHSAEADGEDYGTIKGVGIVPELLIGGTVAPGVVLGGGLIGYSFPSPTFEDADGDEFDSDVTAILSTLDFFVNIYPDPKQGLQLQALIGFAVVDVTDNDTDESLFEGGDTPTGPVFGAGIGYEGFVGKEWSVGVMGRVVYAPTSGTISSSLADVEVKVSSVVPSVSFIATFH